MKQYCHRNAHLNLKQVMFNDKPLIIMGDRCKNFEDPIPGTRDMRKTRFDLFKFSL